MNRREFVKALAGIPLLGLLAKLPKAQEGINLIMPGDPGYIDISVSSPWHTMVYEGNRLVSDDDPAGLFGAAYNELALDSEKQPAFELSNDGGDWMLDRYKDENGDWQTRVMFGSPPTDLHWDNDPTPGISYWNGQEWIRM